MRRWRRAHAMSREQAGLGRRGSRWRGGMTMAAVLGLMGALLSAAVPGAAQAAAPTWSVVPTPDRPGVAVGGLSCVSASSCTAAGWFHSAVVGTPDQALIQTWNGTTWSVVSGADRGTGNNDLAAVTCRSATSCTAVGTYDNSSSLSQTLVETWNGATWSLASSPDNGTGANALSGVSCASASSCVAVGSYAAGTRALVESWNGSAWSVVSSPEPGVDDQLPGVSCVSAVSCTAAGGFSGAPEGTQRALIETSS